MDVYLYSYKCKKWYGNKQGVRNIYIDKDMSDNEILSIVAANKVTDKKETIK